MTESLSGPFEVPESPESTEVPEAPAAADPLEGLDPDLVAAERAHQASICVVPEDIPAELVAALVRRVQIAADNPGAWRGVGAHDPEVEALEAPWRKKNRRQTSPAPEPKKNRRSTRGSKKK